MKSLLKYPGSKWKSSEWILCHFPKHKVYLEPYFGYGACFFNKQPSYIETVNDMYNEMLSNWFTDTCRSQIQTGQLRSEKLWMNFPYQYSLFYRTLAN